MRQTAVTAIGRVAVASACAAALVASGCGSEVSGQGSVDAGPALVVPGSPPSPPGAVEPPPANAVVDYQIGGAYPPAAEVGIVIRDRSQPPVDGVYSICYLNAFQAQPDEVGDWAVSAPDLVLRGAGGVAVEDVEWDEPLLDISSEGNRSRLVEIVDGWMADCADRGFRAVEPDNLDSWTRSRGLLTRADAVAYATLLVERAHARGLAVAQKNAADLSDEELRRIGFDFAVAEDCQRYSWGRGSECDRYMSVHGDRVIEIEYSDGGVRVFETACRARGDRLSILLRDRDVVPRGEPGHVNRTC